MRAQIKFSFIGNDNSAEKLFNYVVLGILEVPKGSLSENGMQTIAFQPGGNSCSIKFDNEALDDKDYQPIQNMLTRDCWRIPQDAGIFSCQILTRLSDIKSTITNNEIYIFMGPLIVSEPIGYDVNVIHEYIKQGMAVNFMMDEFHQLICVKEQSVDRVDEIPENYFLQYLWGFEEKYAIRSTISFIHKKAMDQYFLLAIKKEVESELNDDESIQLEYLSSRYMMHHLQMIGDKNFRIKMIAEHEAGLFPAPSALTSKEEFKRIEIKKRVAKVLKRFKLNKK